LVIVHSTSSPTGVPSDGDSWNVNKSRCLAQYAEWHTRKGDSAIACQYVRQGQKHLQDALQIAPEARAAQRVAESLAALGAAVCHQNA
jgi:hypothetical protein